MNGKVSKRLRIAAVRHYIQNNANSGADPAVILKRTYKQFKKMYKANPYHQRFNFDGHSVVLNKIHDLRERSKVEKFLDPKTSDKTNRGDV